MPLNHQIESFFQKHLIKNGKDKRSVAEIQQQRLFVRQLSQKNINAFNIKLTSKKNMKYPSSELKRIQLEDGVYCYLTDNQNQNDQTIFTLHGAPGNHKEWAGLQTILKGKCRWINLLIPGFDGQNQTRGSYDSTFQGFSNLFLRIIKRLRLNRVILCAHSFGTMIGIRLAASHPHIIEGFINIAGITNIWSIGMTVMYKAVVTDHFQLEDERKQLNMNNLDNNRDQIYERYKNNYTNKKYEHYKIPKLAQTQYFAFLKLCFQPPREFGQIFNFQRNISKLALLPYGYNDHLVPPEAFQATIDSLLRKKQLSPHYLFHKKLYSAIKIPLERRLKQILGIDIEGEKVQEYLCVAFDETGHNVHRRRPEELSKFIEAYLISLQVIHQNEILMKSSL